MKRKREEKIKWKERKRGEKKGGKVRKREKDKRKKREKEKRREKGNIIWGGVFINIKIAYPNIDKHKFTLKFFLIFLNSSFVLKVSFYLHIEI